jgi:hypothetical protein
LKQVSHLGAITLVPPSNLHQIHGCSFDIVSL